ncbi:hypothetical protein [Coraliomargarita parva]|uniref:hypothetical protein n=1 Tax=Coraliomargarita parva TaxID=3014050 RepID=UPI0022B462B8|nr:hypothetical protein [Coraliomargarita parva]
MTRLTLLLISLCFPASLHARDESFIIKFRTYGMHPGIYNGLSYRDNTNASTGLVFASKSRSTEYFVKLSPENPVIRFYRNETTAKEGAQNNENAVTEIRVHPKDAELLLIFRKTTAMEREAYSVFAINDSASVSPPNSLRILNLTGFQVNCSLNGKRFDLEYAQASDPIIPDKTNEAKLVVVAEGITRYHLIYKRNLKIRRDERSLLILCPPARQGSHRIGGHLLTEHL